MRILPFHSVSAFGDTGPLDLRDVTITVLYDNYEYKAGLRTDWGFSCLIRGTPKTVLFDTGTNGDLLMENMKKLDVDPGEVDLVVLSHIHADHVGGLPTFLSRNHDVTVYMPWSFPKNIEIRIQQLGAKVIRVMQPAEICPNVYSTGEMGTSIKEQGLIIDTTAGMIIITGCAHPGIAQMVEKANPQADKTVILTMGGFHLIGTSDNGVKKIIEEFRRLNVRNAGPCHCTGDEAIDLFREAYGDNFVKIGVGKTITFPDQTSHAPLK